MYDARDPRAALAAGPAKPPPTTFAGGEYVKFYEIRPQEEAGGTRTWYARGQNFILAYSEAAAGAAFQRPAGTGEQILLLPDATPAEIATAAETAAVRGGSLVIVPPGESRIRIAESGRVVRLFTAGEADLARCCANAAGYAEPHPNVALLEPWPEPVGGHRIRRYDLDTPIEPGRFGRIWRSTCFMVNYFPASQGPRDPTKLSPHSHDDFEQCSLVLEGAYVHHLRWPWTTNKQIWREDDHEHCGAPSVAVIPPPAIHTSEAVTSGRNHLVDIFCPPRRDFSEKAGWVLNADEFPMP